MEKLTGTFTFLTEGLVIQAILEEGQLKATKGECVLSVEAAEMNTVRIERTSGVEYLELSHSVRWLPEKEEGMLS